MNKLKKGILVLFEGGESCGKSTAQESCFNYLSSKYDTVKMREPGTAPVSEGIRDLLLNHPEMKMSNLTELFLYEAARTQFVEDLLKPALQQHKLVLSDRYYYSTIAYQGFGRGIDLRVIDSLNKIATTGIRPDIAFIFDVPYEIAAERMRNAGKSPDRIERLGKEFHEKVRQGYLYAANNKEAVKIDGTLSKEAISKQVISMIEDYLNPFIIQ
ncbi:MAG: dTMP kinase [archaeon]